MQYDLTTLTDYCELGEQDRHWIGTVVGIGPAAP